MLKFFKNHFFRVTFLIYVLVLGILVSGVYFMFINQQTIIQKEKIQKDSLAKAELMVKIADEKFYMIEQIAIQVSNSRWKTYAASKSDVLYSQLDYFKKMEICQQIETLNVILQIAKSTAVIFPQKNVVVDGSSFWEIERYLKAIGLNEEWSGVLEEILTDSDKSMKILAEKQVGNDNGNFIVVKHLTQNTISGDALFVFVDGKYFQKFININMMDVTYFAICLDGETIFATKQVDLEDQVQEVRLSSELYPWEYSFLVRVNNKESEIGNIYYILVGYLGVLLVVTIFSFVLARMTCLPIVKLMKKLGGKDEDVYYGLERLEQIFLEMQIGKEHMEEMANQYYQIGQNSFLVSLLLGGYDKEYILEYVRKFHTDFAEDMKYLVVIFYFEDMKKQDFFLEEMLKFQIDCMHDKISAMMCNVEARYAMILGAEADTEILVHKKEKLNLFVDEHLQEMELEVYIGDLHVGFQGIHCSYQEAKDKMLRGINWSEQMYYYYPIDDEICMINQLKNGNFKAVHNILSDLERENSKRKVLPQIEMRVINMISECMYRFAMDMKLDVNIKSNQYIEYEETGDIARLWNSLKDILVQIEALYQKERQLHSLGISLLKYVDENYTCSGLTQQGIADLFGVSRPTVSKTFKETVNMNFVDYLHKQRVEHAKKLIATGNYDVLKVAMESGYENEITFKRAFVKNEGITPREYIKRVKLKV